MAALSASSSLPWCLAVTIPVIVMLLMLCGEIQTAATAAGGTLQQLHHEQRTSGELMAPRTFGRIRMMRNFMLPMMFLLGGIKMLLMFLVGITLKTLFVAMSILVVNLSIGLAKVINFFKHSHGHHGHSGFGGGGGGWPPLEKNININIHSDPGHTLSLDGPPSIHSSPFPYTTRADILEPVYTAPTVSQFSSNLYGANPLRSSQPYSSWPSISRSR